MCRIFAPPLNYPLSRAWTSRATAGQMLKLGKRGGSVRQLWQRTASCRRGHVNMLQNSVEAFALRAVTSAWRARRGVAVLAGSLAMVLSGSASAESISRALARAYLSNPDINQQRANVRSVDENIPRATSGYYPKVNATGNVGYEYLYSARWRDQSCCPTLRHQIRFCSARVWGECVPNRIRWFSHIQRCPAG